MADVGVPRGCNGVFIGTVAAGLVPVAMAADHISMLRTIDGALSDISAGYQLSKESASNIVWHEFR